MDRKYEVSDSTDWLNTSLSSFSALEASLRCQVCKDFFDTPMITSCSHTFCSLCIRRCLAAEGKCPACRTSDDASKLRRNWTVEEVVDTFSSARPAALELARKKETVEEERGIKRRSSKRKIEDTDIEEDGDEPRRSQRKTRSQAKRIEEASSQTEVISLDGETTEDEYKPGEEPDDGLVPCPMCNKRMKEEAVYLHLDRCEEEQRQERRSRNARSRSLQPRNQSNRPSPTPTRLPQLNYSLLKDNALRKKLQELGIPTWGPKQLLVRRHTEWINLFNSNCDSSRPRSKTELLRELDSWERSQGGHSREAAVPAVMRKDFDGKSWAQNNTDQFQSLIAAARAKRGPPKDRTENGESKETERGDARQEDDTPVPVVKTELPVSDTENEGSESPFAPQVESVADNTDTLPVLNGHSVVEEAIGDPEVLPNAPHIQPTPPSPSAMTNSATTVQELPLPPTKKLPMFAVPEDTARDLDPGQTAQ